MGDFQSLCGENGNLIPGTEKSMINTNVIHTLSGSEPHESWGSWENYLASCEVRGKTKGCIWYGKTNCNYFHFTSDNTLHENYGYNGLCLWNRIQKEGANAVLARIKKCSEAAKKILQAIEAGDWEEAEEASRELATA